MQYYDKKAVGMRIKEARKNKGMTQCGLSLCLDYTSERQLQRIESGETSCSVDKLMEISQILDVSADYLLFGTDRNRSERFVKCFEGKSGKQTEYLCRLLETAGENMGLLG